MELPLIFLLQKKKEKKKKTYTWYMMMHKNQYAGMLRTTVMALVPERKEKTIKGERCNPIKDLPTVKSVFSLEQKDEKL